MDTSRLKKFATFARRSLMEQVSSRLQWVLADNSAARREQPDTIRQLEVELRQSGEAALVERVAYIWFNRFCALRFMDVNRYTRIGVVSPADGQFQPEILAEAKMGHIDETLADAPTRAKIQELLAGKAPSADPQTEAYRLLLVAACNDWHRAMPYLFEKINDYTELLMPEDLLSGNSILAYTREALTPNACQDVEVIGWLYQFYISEKKDAVFAGLKKKKKITPENIPAATQLFTPHWIVRYLVENSLGRLWMLNHPQSQLIEQMAYYIKPEEPETDFLKIGSPEEIKICDPACGSGHMLTYAFDLLYAIYEESGYAPSEIPEKILTHNLYGIEIDERAGSLAAFALTMKARARQRRFFRQPVQPNICVLENIALGQDTLQNYARVFGKIIFSDDVLATLQQFNEAKNFGALITPKTSLATEALTALRCFKARSQVGLGSESELPPEQQLLVSTNHFEAICKALKQADYLSPKYHVVIANPPYMGGKGMNGGLSDWLKNNFQDSKSDLFSAFIERSSHLIFYKGCSAMVTMESWMFLSSYEKLRDKLLDNFTISSMVHMPYLGKGGTSMGISFGTTAFVIEKRVLKKSPGQFCCVRYFETDAKGVPLVFPPRNERLTKATTEDFRNIPGSPIAYWASEQTIRIYKEADLVSSHFDVRQGLATADDARFLRYWPEVDSGKFSHFSGNKWFPFQKGGEFRKWFGNHDIVINWKEDGRELRNFARSVIRNPDYYFQKGITWSIISSGSPSFRSFDDCFVFGHVGPGLFISKKYSRENIIGFLNSRVSVHFLSIISETFKYEVGHVSKLPVLKNFPETICVPRLVQLSKLDWDSFEGSWDFTSLQLLTPDNKQQPLKVTYQNLRAHWQAMTLEMQQLEEENNRIFIEAYGLQDELTPEVPLKEITLTCNPHYRYGGDKTEAELESLLLADTMKEFISYAVGCMFGRYALEKPGLILANQGETLQDYLKQIPEPSFPADKDNVIPILDGDWFSDDITERFRRFLRLTFGEEHFVENLRFIEKAIGKDLRKYFLKDFYTDHVKRYKKRPIYWLFSSPKGSFNALIYMHRYQPDTVSIVLNDYLREFNTKLSARLDYLKRIEANAEVSKAERSKALKDIESLRKTLDELDTWEREVMYPLATEKIKIDLDDGVKVNYPKFGSALKKIPGLDAKGED